MGAAPIFTHKQRRHFVRDGEVPVEVVRRNQALADHSGFAELEHRLRLEQQMRQQAEQSLREARDQIRSLQTRLAHAEIATQEAMRRPQAEPPPTEQPSGRSRVARSAAEDDGEPVVWWKPGWTPREGC